MERLLPHQWLAVELSERKAANPRYSLRMMAQRAGLTPGRLSEFVAGKRPITMKQAEKIADRLNFGAEKRMNFFDAVHPLATPSDQTTKDEAYRQLSADAFSVVADWYHFAILSLMEVDGFKMNVSWISKRLGISEATARASIIRLQKVGLIVKKDKRWIKAPGKNTTTNDVPSAALKISHRQSLQQAIESLDEVAVELRDITSITMAVDIQSIPLVKKMIKDFRRRVASTMERGDRTEVYNLNVQLVPVTRITSKKVLHDV